MDWRLGGLQHVKVIFSYTMAPSQDLAQSNKYVFTDRLTKSKEGEGRILTSGHQGKGQTEKYIKNHGVAIASDLLISNILSWLY